MPVINLKISGQEDAALAQQLVTEIGRLTKDVLHKMPEVTVVLVSFVPDHLWFVDAVSLAEQKAKSFHLVIRISDSTNLKVDKSNYIQAVHESLSAVLGGVHPVSYTAIQEMKADAYGYDGATIEYKLITNQQKLKTA
jgi:4-oxalocrotonate tautomerase